MPSMPSSARASFTSSSLKGLMIASSFFIAGKLARARLFAKPKLIAARALLATRLRRRKHPFLCEKSVRDFAACIWRDTHRCVPKFGRRRSGALQDKLEERGEVLAELCVV